MCNTILKQCVFLICFVVSGIALLSTASAQIFDPSGRTVFPQQQSTPGTLNRGLISNTPAFQHPKDPLPCFVPILPSVEPLFSRQQSELRPSLSPTPVTNDPRTWFRGRAGAVQLTPDRLVAPVGSEVVLLAGICGPDGYFVTRQPIQWLMSQESVGNFISVSDAENNRLGEFLHKHPRIVNNGFAKGRTGAQSIQLSRGTPETGDDIIVKKGQAWASLTSPSEGTTYITVLAPEADGWDQRRKTATIHWIDAEWELPPSAVVPAGTSHPLTVRIKRPSDGSAVENWIVRYEIMGSNPPAGFLPAKSGKAEVRTNYDGEATVQVVQAAEGKLPGRTQVRIEVIRPPFGNNPRSLKVAEAVSQINWTSPALELQVTGPSNAASGTDVNYRVQVRNPGDLPARNVVIRSEIPAGMEFVSSQPKPSNVYGAALEWNLGTIDPRTVPVGFDIQLRPIRQGTIQTRFEAISREDNLKTEASINTFVSVPCIALSLTGPSSGEVGDQLRYKIKISNVCERSLKDLELEVNFDEGFDAPGHTSPMRYKVPRDLNFGESDEVDLVLIPRKSGRHCFNVNVRGGKPDFVTSDAAPENVPVDTATAQKCVDITAPPRPSVSIDVRGPARMEVGEEKTFDIEVTNNGNVPLHDLFISSQFSKTFDPKFASAGHNENWWEDGELRWRYAELLPGKSISLKVVHQATLADGQAINSAKVQTSEGATDQDQTATFVSNPGETGLRIDEQDDGLELTPAANQAAELSLSANSVERSRVGDVIDVQVVVENRNLKPAENVIVTVELPPELELIDQSGNPVQNGSSSIRILDRRYLRTEKDQTIVRLQATTPGSFIANFRVKSNMTQQAQTVSTRVDVKP